MRKDVKNELMKINKILPVPVRCEKKKSGHYRFLWEMENKYGEIRKMMVQVGSTPSCHRWTKNHWSNVKSEMHKNHCEM